jgi:hypothetical protein
MNRWQAWSSHIVTVIVGTSGIIYLFIKYFMQTNDPFSVVNHPLQPFMLDAHVFTAPLLVFLFGLMFESHVQKKLKLGNSVNRRTGLAAGLTFGLMTLSGYALQVTSSEILSRAAVVLHLLCSGLFLFSYVMHQTMTFRLWRARVRRENGRSLAQA